MGLYLVDTNIVVQYFTDKLSVSAKAFLKETFHPKPNISIITAIELLSWINPDREIPIRAFVESANVFMLTSPVVNRCVKIRRSKKVKTPDAIIAATAITEGLTLITRDEDFASINGLQVFDPSNNFL